MSKKLDEFVVSMQFDNKQFESNVQTSLSTIEKLKQSIKSLVTPAREIEGIGDAAGKVNMSPLASAVEGVKVKFSALQVMAITALANITNSAVNAGKRLVAAFTIDPIKTGMAEYETQINAVQTILANTSSKGTTLEQVNNALDELNHYADMTIYNFTEMTRNIGTFTAAGVDLDTSVSAIKGIANLAAVSGSTSHQASVAMYQLSQALAAGTVKLIDWNSVVNAGMGGQVFQDALKETARVNGVAIDDMIEKHGSFRETLQEGWLTSEVLTKTLAKFTGDLSEEQLKEMGYSEEQIKEIIKLGQTANDAATKVKTFTQLINTLKEAAQSGWTQTWEILIGDFEEAKALWTTVSDYFSEVLNKSAEARNSMLQSWSDMGGRADILESFKNVFKAILSVVNPIKEAFREIFPPTTAKQLYDITAAIKEFTSKLILSEEAQAKVKSTFKGLFAIIDIGVTFIKEVVSGIAKLIGKLSGLGGGVITLTGSIGDFISKLRDSIKEAGLFGKIVGRVTDILSTAIEKVSTFVKKITEKIANPSLDLIYKLFKGICDVLTVVTKYVGEFITSIGKGLGDALGRGDIKDVQSLINGGILTAILVSAKKSLSGFGEVINTGKSITEQIKEILISVKGVFEAYQRDLNAKALLKIAAAIAILTGAIMVIASIDSNKLTASLAAMATLLASLIGSLAVLNKVFASGSGIKGILGGFLRTAVLRSAVTGLITMSRALLLLAIAMRIIADIDVNKMLASVVAVAALMGILIGASKLMTASGKGTKKTAKTMITMAAAVLILAVACEKLGGIDADGLKRGVLALAAIMAELLVFFKLMPNNVVKMGSSLLALSTALLIISFALTRMGKMSWKEIAKGLAAFGGSIAILAVGLKFMKGTMAGSVALILAAVGLSMLVIPLLLMGKIKWENIAKGLVTLAATLTILGIAAGLLSTVLAPMLALVGILALTGGAMIVLGLGLAAIASAFKINDFGVIAKGLMAIGGALLLFSLLALPAAIISPLLYILGSALIALGKGLMALAGAFLIINFGTIALGLMALAGSLLLFSVLALPALLLSPLLLLLAVAMTTLAKGVMMLSSGLILLIGAVAGSGVLVLEIIKELFNSLISFIPKIAEAIGKGIIAILNLITNSVDAIANAFKSIIMAITKALKESLPVIVDAVFSTLETLLKSLLAFTPKLIKIVTDLIVAVLNGLTEALPKIVEAAVNLIIAFIDGISTQMPRVVQAGFNAVMKFIDGITTAIDNNTPILIAKMQKLFLALLRAAVLVLTGGVVDIYKVGEKIMSNGLIKGISDKIGNLKKTVSKGITGAKDAIKGRIGEWLQVGRDMVGGIVKGVTEKFTSIRDAAVNAVSNATEAVKKFLGINSPSKVFAAFGRGMDEGLVVGLNEYSGQVADSAEGVGKDAVNTMSKSIAGIADVVDSDVDTEPTIRPVLDLSDVKAGAGAIDGMLGSDRSVGVMANVRSIGSMMNNRQNGSNSDVIYAIKSLASKLDGSPRNVYNINGITYDDGSAVSNAVGELLRATTIEGRI